MVRRALGAVVLRRHGIQRPRARRVAGVGHGEIDRVPAREVAVGLRVQRRDHDDEALVVRVVVADRVDHPRPDHSCCSVDCRRIVEERVEVLHAGQGSPRGVADAQNAVRRLDHEPVPHAQRLVGWLQGELVATIGESLIAVSQPVDAGEHVRVGASEAARGHDRRIERLLGEHTIVESGSSPIEGVRLTLVSTRRAQLGLLKSIGARDTAADRRGSAGRYRSRITRAGRSCARRRRLDHHSREQQNRDTSHCQSSLHRCLLLPSPLRRDDGRLVCVGPRRSRLEGWSRIHPESPRPIPPEIDDYQNHAPIPHPAQAVRRVRFAIARCFLGRIRATATTCSVRRRASVAASP